MEQTDNMQLVKKNNHYELVVLESAVFEDYERNELKRCRRNR